MNARTTMLTLCLALAAAAPAAPLIQGKFKLTDVRSGRTVDQDSYKGRLRLVFFGFTHCRVTCPVGMARLGEALRLLGKDASHVATLFITIDPDRDTAAVMKDFASAFSPDIAPLRGSPRAVQAAMRSFRLESQRVDEGGGSYQLEHPALIFLMDRDGTYLDALPSSGDAATLVRRVRQALHP
jgi:protein SCO1/2